MYYYNGPTSWTFTDKHNFGKQDRKSETVSFQWHMSERRKCCLCRKGRSSVKKFSPKEKERKKERQGCLKKHKKERQGCLKPLAEGLQTFSLSEDRLRNTVAKESKTGEEKCGQS